MSHVWGADKRMLGCGWETERNHLEDLSLDGGSNIKMYLIKLESFHLTQFLFLCNLQKFVLAYIRPHVAVCSLDHLQVWSSTTSYLMPQCVLGLTPALVTYTFLKLMNIITHCELNTKCQIANK